MNEAAEPRTNGECIRIIIADSDRRVRQALRALLQTHPRIHILAEASSARALLDLAQAQQPDVILLDVMLPLESDGLGAISQLVQTGFSAIIVLSTASQWRMAAKKAGTRVFLDKGINADLILSTIVDTARTPRNSALEAENGDRFSSARDRLSN